MFKESNQLHSAVSAAKGSLEDSFISSVQQIQTFTKQKFHFFSPLKYTMKHLSAAQGVQLILESCEDYKNIYGRHFYNSSNTWRKGQQPSTNSATNIRYESIDEKPY